MALDHKGRLVLKPVTDPQIQQRVAAYLTKFMKNTSPEKLMAVMGKGSLVLGKNIPAGQAQKITAGLKKLGATSIFKAHEAPTGQGGGDQPALQSPSTQPNQVAPGPKPPPVPPASPPVSPPRPTGEKSKGKAIRIILLSVILAGALAVLGWRSLPFKSQGPLQRTTAQPPKVTRVQFDFTAWHPIGTPSPPILAVPPDQMMTAAHYQYRVRPDMRFVQAFKVLAKMMGRLGGDEKKQAYVIGDMLSNGREILVPVIKNGQAAAEIKIALPMTFSGGMSGLEALLALMPPAGPQSPETTGDAKPTLEQRLSEAEQSINRVDPRDVIHGLTQLETLWQQNGPHVEILRRAIRGYCLLLMVLAPDKMEYGDVLAAHALSFLALAGHLDPEASLSAEEALLAMVMSYTAHAAQRFQAKGQNDDDLIVRVAQAYASRNVDALKALNPQNDNILVPFFLSRLYRELGLGREAEQTASELLNRYPDHYPGAVEIIYSGNLGQAKILTLLYPQDILFYLKQKILPREILQLSTWLARIKSEKEQPAVATFSRFESLLNAWRPLDDAAGGGMLIDQDRVKTVFRMLYSQALDLRFTLLMDRWNVLDQAGNYVAALAAEDQRHPLVMDMLIDVFAAGGDLKQSNAMVAQMIQEPNTPGSLAAAAWNRLAQQHQTIPALKLAPTVADRLDGRPRNLLNTAWLLRGLQQYDAAEKFSLFGIERDPMNFRAYLNLARTQGREAPILDALDQYPENIILLEEAAAYYAAMGDPESLERAIRFYDAARNLAPGKDTLYLEQAEGLNQLGRHQDAALILESWLKKYSSGDLTTVHFKARLADTYLKMAQPGQALAVIADEVTSMKGSALTTAARAYQAQGNVEEAEALFLQAMERYPGAPDIPAQAAAFYWEQGRNEKAAQIIAQGRQLHGPYTRWYFNQFMKVFAEEDDKKVLKAVSQLLANGAGSWEISSLGHGFNPDRPELADRIIDWSKVTHPMLLLEKTVSLYSLRKKTKGKQDALAYLRKAIPREMHGHLMMVLFKEGLFEEILSEYPDPGQYGKEHGDNMWLMKLMAWLALHQQPSDLERVFTDHYQKSSSNHYHTAGRFLLGYLPEKDVMDAIKTPKQRCEMAYYLGFHQRMQGHFENAADWYHICRDTLLEKNGEFHWASNELFWWTHMGTQNRHRLLADDKKAYRDAQNRKVRDY